MWNAAGPARTRHPLLLPSTSESLLIRTRDLPTDQNVASPVEASLCNRIPRARTRSGDRTAHIHKLSSTNLAKATPGPLSASTLHHEVLNEVPIQCPKMASVSLQRKVGLRTASNGGQLHTCVYFGLVSHPPACFLTSSAQTEKQLVEHQLIHELERTIAYLREESVRKSDQEKRIASELLLLTDRLAAEQKKYDCAREGFVERIRELEATLERQRSTLSGTNEVTQRLQERIRYLTSVLRRIPVQHLPRDAIEHLSNRGLKDEDTPSENSKEKKETHCATAEKDEEIQALRRGYALVDEQLRETIECLKTHHECELEAMRATHEEYKQVREAEIELLKVQVRTLKEKMFQAEQSNDTTTTMYLKPAYSVQSFLFPADKGGMQRSLVHEVECALARAHDQVDQLLKERHTLQQEVFAIQRKYHVEIQRVSGERDFFALQLGHTQTSLSEIAIPADLHFMGEGKVA